MSFTRWLRHLQSFRHLGTTDRKSRRATRSGPAKRFRPHLEALEDRCLLAFLVPVSYASGANAYDSSQAMVTADFNGDSRFDLAVANQNSNNMSVLLGNADGTFQPAVTSASGAYSVSLAVGDFNADGKLDLVAGGNMFLGNGNGTFQPARAFYFHNGADASHLAVGDFNADGKLDLVAPNDTSLSLVLGNGDGTFQYPSVIDIAPGASAATVAIGDFNGDARLDLVALNWGYSGPVSVLLGNGNGTFQPALNSGNSASGVAPSHLAVGDFNGDGKLDLATANSGAVSVQPGNGNGTFQAPDNSIFIGSDLRSVSVGDFNADGKLDLMATSNQFTCTSSDYYGCNDGFWSGNVNVLLGRGDGAFTTPMTSTVEGGFLTSEATGDLNGDGFPDVAVVDYNTKNVAVLINDLLWPPADLPLVTINDVNVTEGNTGTTAPRPAATTRPPQGR